MKTLLPYKYRKWAWITFILSCILGINDFKRGYQEGYNAARDQDVFQIPEEGYEPLIPFLDYGILPNLADMFLVIALFLIVFTKDKIHDELSDLVNYKSLSIAFIISVAVVSILQFFFGELEFNLSLFVLFQLMIYWIVKAFVKSDLIDQ